MPPKADTSEGAPAVGSGPLAILTPREQAIMLQSLLTIKGFPSGIAVDYQKVADRMGLTNPRSVSNAWTIIKKKIAEFDKKDRKERGLPSEDEDEADNGDGEDGNPTPKKRARATKAATTPRGRGKTATPGSSAKKTRGSGKKAAAGGMLADLGVPAAAAGAPVEGEEDDEEMIKQDEEMGADAGLIKLEREADENGVELFVSGEI